ncbi:hypothetical protein BJ165DRAFT_1515279 [Panaeolus papilionaceus]|nr:hypothetical protein BJ165DRAFT_1515279 [Panaeolus papilionaceus]
MYLFAIASKPNINRPHSTHFLSRTMSMAPRPLTQREESLFLSTMPEIPLDLLEPILEQLGQLPSEEQLIRRTYASIGLVCKALLPYSRRQLFNRITIGCPISLTNTSSSIIARPFSSDVANEVIDQQRMLLARIIEETPSISSHIRHLSWVIFPEELRCSNYEDVELTMNRFLNLPRVRSLDIKSRYKMDYGGCLPSYQDSNPKTVGFRRVVETYLAFGTLTSLSFTRINDIPIINILSSPSLQSLILVHCSITEWTPDQLKDRNCAQFGLKNLGIYDMFSTVRPLLPYLEELETLRVDYPFQYGGSDRSMRNETELPSLPSDAPPAFRKLRILEYVNYRRCPPQWTYFTSQAERKGVSSFPELKRLTIDVRSHQYDPFRKPLQLEKIRDIKSVLANSPSLEAFNFMEYNSKPDMIQELELQGYVDRCRELSFHLPFVDYISGESTRSFIRILGNLRKRNALQTLKVTFNMDEPKRESERAVIMSGPPRELWAALRDAVVGDALSFPVLELMRVDVSVMRASLPPSRGGAPKWLANGYAPQDLELVRESVMEKLQMIERSGNTKLDVSAYYVEICEFQG